MNICILCKTFHRNRGGAESYAVRMAKVFANMGHSVHIIAAKGREKYYVDGVGPNIHVHKIDFKEASFRGSWLFDLFFPVAYVRYSAAVRRKIISIHKDCPIDIVESSELLAQGWALSFKRFLPLVVRLHGYHQLKDLFKDKSIAQLLRTFFIWIMERRLISSADSVNTVSVSFSKEANRLWHTDKKIEVLYSGIDQNVFRPDGDLRREKAVLFVGRFEETKGIEILTQAIPIVSEKHPDTIFYFAGRDRAWKGTAETWKGFITKNLPSARLVFLGELSTEDLVKYYQKCQVGAFPSLYEPGATVVAESMACGCATVSTRVGGIPEIVNDGVDGLLIPPQDPHALATAVIKLLSDPDLVSRISRNGVSTITKKFNLVDIANQTIDFYERAIKYNAKG